MAGKEATILVRALSSSGAEGISKAALQEARSLKLKPVSVAVVDVAGRLLMHRCEDGVGTLVSDLALAKAKSCMMLKMSTRQLREKYAVEKPTQLAAMGIVSPGGMAPFPGGVVCFDPTDGSIVGAVGVSGASSEEDEHCAITGAKALGFKTEPEKSEL